MIPKEGGNRFKGSFFTTFTLSELQANNIDQDLIRAGVTDPTVKPRVKRTFVFDDSGGGWQINDRFFDGNHPRFIVQEDTAEQWTLINDGGDWEHPIHIHMEEFQTLSINGRPPAASPQVTIGRQDVLRLEADAQAMLFIRFRDFTGKYPMHCHNTIHEDHAMMLRFDVGPLGDTKQSP